MGILDFLIHHWTHALPIVIAAVIAVAIMVERTRALFYQYPIKDEEKFMEHLSQLILSNRIDDAIAYCDQFSGKPATRLIKAALKRSHLPEDSVRHAVELSLGEASRSIQKRTAFLATIANVTTLLGLFGTIAGLIASFEAVSLADPQQKSALLAAGISTAMNATMLGLAVAIPCMIAFSFLANRANRLAAEMEDAAVRVIDWIKLRYYADLAHTQAPQAAPVRNNIVSMKG